MLGLIKLWRCRRGRSNGDAARNRTAILGAFICAALTSCAVGPDYLPPSPPLPPNFAATSSSLNAPSDRHAYRPLETTQWWRLLHDRELDSLVERALAASPTLEIALDRLATGARSGTRRHRRGADRRRSGPPAGAGAPAAISRVVALRKLSSPRKPALASRKWSILPASTQAGSSIFSASTGARSRQRNTMSTRQSPPGMSCWYRSSPMSFAPTSICARSRWSLRSYAKISRWRASTSISSRNAIAAASPTSST